MTPTITRRRLVLATASLPILRLVPEIKPSTARASEPSGISFDGRLVSWQELADDLARMERRGVESENPRTWDRKRYDDLARWSDSMLLVFGFGDAKWSEQRVEELIEFFDDSTVEIMAVGQSLDFRAWTMFLEARLHGAWDGQRWPIGLAAHRKEAVSS